MPQAYWVFFIIFAITAIIFAALTFMKPPGRRLHGCEPRDSADFYGMSCCAVHSNKLLTAEAFFGTGAFDEAIATAHQPLLCCADLTTAIVTTAMVAYYSMVRLRLRIITFHHIL